MPSAPDIPKLPLSVAIVTKNEEELLAACLGSVSFADEIVLVDSGSTDRTLEIAREFGCRIYVEDWKGYGFQMNSAVEKCGNEWVLIMDADESIPEETRQAIEGIVALSSAADAYSFPRKNHLHGRWMRHSDMWPDRVVRLVRKGTGRFHVRSHGKWRTEGLLDESLLCPINHYSFNNYSDLIETINKRSTAVAREQYGQVGNIWPLTPVLHGLLMFLRIYILKLGFLDGFDGLALAVGKGMGSFFKYAKIIELRRNSKDSL
jgi:glycosyltransferase involved in cell wall biosynthesis